MFPSHDKAIWDSGLSLTGTKNITIVGSGTPIITRGSTSDPLITIQPSSGNPSVRISGFKFDNGTNTGTEKNSILIRGKSDGTGSGLTNIRIDHNYFNKGRHAVYLIYWVEAVIDSNTFNNCDVAVMVLGDNSFSWKREIAAGTVHANFIEDNTFLADESNRDVNLSEQIYHQSGGVS